MKTSKIFSVAAAFLFASGIALADEVDLFILAGQSNAQGWQGRASSYPEKDQSLDKKIPFYWVTPKFSSSDGKWTTLQPQGGRFPDGHFGLEITFARALKKAGLNPAIFKYTLGATGLAQHWKRPGEGGMYDDMVSELKKAIGLQEAQGHSVHVRAFIWIQGENDATVYGRIAVEYKDRLKDLIEDLRKNVIRDPELAIILGLDEQHPNVKKNPIVITAQEELAKEMEHVVRTSMLGLEKADSSHLKPAALEEHGKRIFDAYRQMSAPSDAGKKPTSRLRAMHNQAF